MGNIVKILESIGQKSSLNQYSTVQEMLGDMNIKNDILHEAFKKSEELVCAIEPADDKL